MPEQQRDQPDAQHPAYAEALPAWRMVRDFASGAAAIRAAGRTYLPQPNNMGDKTYEDMLRGAPILAAVERTLEALVGSASQEPPEVRSGGIPEEQLSDVTGAGDPLIQLARDVLREELTLARVAVEVMPDEQGIPRWRVRPAESLISWRVSRTGGEEVLQRAVISLTETKPVGDWRIVSEPVLRVLVLEEGALHVRTYRRKPDQTGRNKGEWTLAPEDDLTPMVRGAPLPYIPLTITGGWDHISRPPLRGLVETNRAHYVIAAFREYAARAVATPTPYLKTDAQNSYQPLDESGGEEPVAWGENREERSRNPRKPYVLGPDKLWIIGEKEELGYAEIKVGGMGAISEIIDERQAQMQALGARLVFGPAPAQETATAAAIRHAADVSVLVTATDAQEEVMTRALRWHAEQWSGTAQTAAVQFLPNREFLQPPEPIDSDGGTADED